MKIYETNFSKNIENHQKLSESASLYFSRTLPAPIDPGEPVVGPFLEVEDMNNSRKKSSTGQNLENSVFGDQRGVPGAAKIEIF